MCVCVCECGGACAAVKQCVCGSLRLERQEKNDLARARFSLSLVSHAVAIIKKAMQSKLSV